MIRYIQFNYLLCFQHWYSYQYSCLQVIEFLKSQEDCIDLFLRHLSTSAIMDLLLKLVTNIEGQEIKNNVFSVSSNLIFCYSFFKMDP